MLAIFASEGAPQPAGLLGNDFVTFLIVLAAVFIFIKFCGWAKKVQLSAGFKKVIFILTGVGLVVFNVMYSMGNKAFKASEGMDISMATIALGSAMVWVFIFAFALMAETKPE
ncbi:MAG: hypothetical protein ACM3PE_12865 [Deltaproteobacteria bacterium]